MDKIISYVEQNPVIAVAAAAILIFIAGFIVRKFKIIAVVFIIIASLVFYFLLKTDKVGKVKIDEIKKKVKVKVMENIK